MSILHMSMNTLSRPGLIGHSQNQHRPKNVNFHSVSSVHVRQSNSYSENPNANPERIVFFTTLTYFRDAPPAVLPKIQKSFNFPSTVRRVFDFLSQNFKCSYILDFSTERRSPHFGWKLYWLHQRNIYTRQKSPQLTINISCKACVRSFNP